jgi:hypothetical protein
MNIRLWGENGIETIVHMAEQGMIGKGTQGNTKHFHR